MHSWGPKRILHIREIQGPRYETTNTVIDMETEPSVVDLSHRCFEIHLSCGSHGEVTKNFLRRFEHVSRQPLSRNHLFKHLGLVDEEWLCDRFSQGLATTAATLRMWLAGQVAGSGALCTVGGFVLASGSQWLSMELGQGSAEMFTLRGHRDGTRNLSNTSS